jgi:hypothetical protein
MEKQSGRSPKGQMWSFDLALSLIIFFGAAIALFAAWGHMGADIAGTKALKDAQLKALTVSDALLRTPGIPAGWNETTAEVIGLSLYEGVLDPQKVSSFSSMDHDVARVLTAIAPYDFYFELSDINGTVYANTTTPVPASADAFIIVPVERHAIYGGRIARMTLILWG